MNRLCIFIGMLALIALAVAGCSKPPAPSDEEIKALLSTFADGKYDVALNQVESFVEDETAGGRVNVAAAYVATEDLFAVMNEKDVVSAYADLGVPADHLAFINTLQPAPVYLRRVLTKGQRFAFSTDLQVRKAGDEWFFGWDESESVLANIPLEGTTRSNLSTDAVVLDKEESSPHVAKTLALSKEIKAADDMVLASFQKSVAGGKPVTIRFWQVDKPRFGIRNDEPFSMTLTAEPRSDKEIGNDKKPASISVEGPVVFRGIPSDFAGRLLGEGKFYPWKRIRLDGELTRYGKPGSIKSAINLQLYSLDEYAMAKFHRFDGSPSYFEDGRIQTYDKDSYYNWRWAQ